MPIIRTYGRKVLKKNHLNDKTEYANRFHAQGKSFYTLKHSASRTKRSQHRINLLAAICTIKLPNPLFLQLSL